MHLEHESGHGDDTDEAGIGDLCALSTRVEDWKSGCGARAARCGGLDDWCDRGGGLDDNWDNWGDGGHTCVASGDGGGDIWVACGCRVSTFACSALDNSDGWDWGLLVLTLVALVA